MLMLFAGTMAFALEKNLERAHVEAACNRDAGGEFLLHYNNGAERKISTTDFKCTAVWVDTGAIDFVVKVLFVARDKSKRSLSLRMDNAALVETSKRELGAVGPMYSIEVWF